MTPAVLSALKSPYKNKRQKKVTHYFQIKALRIVYSEYQQTKNYIPQ